MAAPGEATRFRKGASGNPGGRPKASAEVVEAARAHTAMCIARLAEIAQGPDLSAAVRACMALLDRGWGRVPETVNLNDGREGPIILNVVPVKVRERDRAA